MQFDLSKQPNKDSLTLWKQLVNLLNTYDDIVSVKYFEDGKKRGVKVQFKNNTKEYIYINKTAVINLLKPEHKNFWKDLPF